MTTLFLNYGVNTGLSVNTFRNAGYFNHDAAICEYELNN